MENVRIKSKSLRLKYSRPLGIFCLCAAFIFALFTLAFAITASVRTSSKVVYLIEALASAFALLLMLNIGITCLKSCIRLYPDRFVYVDPFGRKTEYDFNEVTSCKKILWGLIPQIALIEMRMSDGRRALIDMPMLNSGLGEAIGFDFWHDRFKKGM